MTRARIELLGAAVLFSTGGAAVKACSLTGWQVASFRSAVAALTLGLVLPAVHHGWTARVPLVGIVYAATLVLFVLATKLTTAANAIFLQSTAPLYVALLAPLMLRERTRLADVTFMAVLGTGLVLLLAGDDSASVTAPEPRLGNLVAAASGVTWALTLMGLRWIAATGAAAAVLLGNLVAAAACLPLALPVAPTASSNWLIIVYLGAVQIALAYVLLTRGVRRIAALEAGLLLLLEPVLNPLWTWLLHGERPGAWSLAGGTLILTATAARVLRGEPSPPPL
jgi:DME family drug/metabolite transporter